MKKLYKAALLAALGLGSVVAAQATTYNNDLIVGFTVANGNDAIYDLGAESSLVNGETWNLASLLSGYNLNNVQWGVIGSAGPSTGGTGFNNQRFVYSTDTIIPNTVSGKTAWAAVNGTAIPSIYANFSAAGAGQSLSIAASDPNSWYGSTTYDGGNANTSDFFNAYGNPNVTGLNSIGFYQAIANGSDPTLLGSFTLGNGGIMTFNATSVPEPITFGAFAGAGLLLVSLRNQLRRKQA